MENERQILTDDQDVYYFDRVHINCIQGMNELKAMLPITDLERECRYFALRQSSPDLWRYKTRIEVVTPTKKFFEILSNHELMPDTHHIVTSIEIAHDVFYPSKHDAEYKSYDLFRTIRKKHSRSYIYHRDISIESTKEWRQRLKTRGLFARQTFYSAYENVKAGTRKSWFKLVIYARLSKINWRPCVHYEWRIKKARQIRIRTGIRTIRDMLGLDFKTFFEKMEKKYVILEALDHKKVGMVLAGFEKKRKLTKRQSISVGLAFAHFCACYEVTSFTELGMAARKEIRRLDRIRGPKTAWARKIGKLNNLPAYSRAL
jgi:hypothetical protein